MRNFSFQITQMYFILVELFTDLIVVPKEMIWIGHFYVRQVLVLNFQILGEKNTFLCIFLARSYFLPVQNLPYFKLRLTYSFQ